MIKAVLEGAAFFYAGKDRMQRIYEWINITRGLPEGNYFLRYSISSDRV